MDWKEYKIDVSASREVMVFPFFEKYLASKSGVAIDIGCGDGDLSIHVAKASSATIVGIDLGAEEIKNARLTASGSLHFVKGDVEKNAIPALGIKFDFAFSNCCFSHLSDEGMYRVLVDLHACMRNDGELVFLVPSINWAQSMYADVEYVGSGITALPRYGDRQSFRIPEWYIAALEKSGFELLFHEEITIPDSDRLEDRYRNKVGLPLFSAFCAKRVEQIPNLMSLQKAFEVAHENRKLEIGLFWQRSLFFWGFVATALVGYGTAYSKSSGLTLIFGLFGLVCSIVWAAGNRGSKYWQEYWEDKVSFYQHYTTGNIFFDRHPKSPSMFENYAGRRISVSKLTMALSDYTVILWSVLCAHSLLKTFICIPAEVYSAGSVVLVLLTLCYCLAFLWKSDSED